MVSPERLDVLQRQWVRQLGEIGVAPDKAYPTFDRLVAAYSEPHRHYHTLEHLAEVMRVVSRLATTCKNLPAVLLAVWFHDAVYNPAAHDNEERSARLAVRCLRELKEPPETVLAVETLVLATAHAGEEPDDPDTQVLLDADLAILGASEERYQRYATDIRAEYAFVPDETYRLDRAKILQQFLARSAIYHHPVMIAEGEAAARRNLETELRRLMQPVC